MAKALKITPTTYPVYQALKNPYEYSLQHINGLFLVFDSKAIGIRKWYDEREFRKYYQFVGTPSQTAFTEVIRLEDAE